MRKKIEIRGINRLLKLTKKERTKKENKRVKEFLQKKKALDAMPQQPCKNCDKMIPCPTEYCSSKCRREDSGEEERQNTRDEPKRAQKTLQET